MDGVHSKLYNLRSRLHLPVRGYESGSNVFNERPQAAFGLIIHEVSGSGLSVEALLAELTAKGIDISGIDVSALTGSSYTYMYGASYGIQFYNIMVPFVIIISAVYTAMAVAAIWQKDKPQFWGVSEKPAKIKDYVGIIKGNKEIRWFCLRA